jgi:histidinol phosphatase-like enzyme (inositol monophosphatase family)
MTNELEKRVKLGETLADVSGEIIRQYFRQPYLPADTKQGQVSSLVTIADQEAEQAMVNIIQEKLPYDGIIREEGENIASSNDLAWVIDPIDGTSSFVRGLPIFGTLIALVDLKTDTPLMGIMNQPILQQRWLGIHQQPTQFNHQLLLNPYTQEQNSDLTQACLTSTTPLMFITERQQAISAKLQQVCQRTAFGGDCYNYMTLASGWSVMPMIILESDLNYYDFCALIPIIQGTGAVITNWSGQPLTHKSTEVVAASNQNLLTQALKVISTDNFNSSLVNHE